MNPYQHGEVFVLDDGSEVDLDLGNYERFLDVNLTGDHNITTGKVYRAVIEKERRGDYLGRTVQIIPHVTDEIKTQLQAVGEKERADIVLVEVGGTVGDIEGMPFLEAVRQLAQEIGKDNLLFVHTTLVPIMGAVGEQKTKPTQQTVRLKPKDEDMQEWKAFLENLKNPDKEVTIALVGKYTHLKDSYISHIEAFHHAGAAARVHVKLKWVESVDLEKHGTKLLEGADGILVPRRSMSIRTRRPRSCTAPPRSTSATGTDTRSTRRISRSSRTRASDTSVDPTTDEGWRSSN